MSNPNLLKDIGKGRLDESILSDVEIFVVRLYSPTSTCSSVNELHAAMFKKENPEALPLLEMPWIFMSSALTCKTVFGIHQLSPNLFTYHHINMDGQKMTMEGLNQYG